MTTPEALQKHLAVCDELYQLALEENRHLKQHRRAPDSALLDRKRALLDQLDRSLTSLRTEKAGGESARSTPQLMEKVRARILQVLQLDKENEQLLLRASLSRGVESTPAPAPDPAILQKIYARTSR
jgi:hypothetical protein